MKKSQALAAIVRVLENSEADVVCLQEVWRENGITEDVLEKLTGRIWPHYIFNRNAVFPGGIQGNAILSRYNMKSWRNVDVSFAGTEPRGFVDARIELPGVDGEISVVCLHFGLTEKERISQSEQLARYLAEEISSSTPVAVGGDFNDWTGTVHRRLKGGTQLVEAVETFSGKRGRTFPALFPMLALDRIYYSGLELLEARVLREAGWKGLSDHAPVYARFLIPDAVRAGKKPSQ